jgi:O-antigen/teichoic acid export membrane protein
MTQGVRSALFFSAFSNYGALIITFVTTVVVSRMLTPSQVGAFVLASAFILLVDSVRALSLGSFVIRAPHFDLPLMRSVFGLSMLISVIAATLTIGLSGAVAQLLGMAELEAMLEVMAVSYLLAPFTVPAISALRREMRYRELVVFKLGAAVGVAVVSIGLIVADFGALALAYGFVAGTAAELLLLLPLKTPYKFVRPSVKGWAAILRFSSAVTVTQFVSVLGQKVAQLSVGRFLGLEAAGLWSRAGTLTALYRSGIQSAVFPVAFSALAKEARDGGDVKASYMKATALLTGLSWPLLSVLSILAHPTIILLLGEQWTGAVTTSQILAISVAIYTSNALSTQLLVALGKVETLLKRSLLIQIPRLCLYPLAAQFGILEVALASIVVQSMLVVMNQNILRDEVGITYVDAWHSSRKSLAVTATVVALVSAAYWGCLTLETKMLTQLAAGATVASAAWLLAVRLFGHPAESEMKLLLSKMVLRLRVR